MDRMTKLGETIRTLMDEEFSGYIKVNFSQGSIGRIEKSEEFDAANIVAVDAVLKQARRGKDVRHEA
jgi:hypothetical protein